ncbi:16S rRNA (guanine(966)-N(2))-methyltransferase RsmD [Helicobacter pylori]|uniref:16S rRNA (guanine(966)-N(2))-methyltransferase RsmD n=1 Tax=Helicobacter pylori TaxID=210 RepID=UPI0009937399|nr:16S rRNA (guanine(966)-N(2))-methyltransferase RsmD [Helicobacter pylori]OOP83906.1 16S rRNA (guanine(966)-N(2))-methyltransferase RsmD [Helicobacter pylori]PDW54897.1 16S rRNA (guanine(966)-N(2))-methyltransferase RsmD [Helicobacter pylori]
MPNHQPVKKFKIIGGACKGLGLNLPNVSSTRPTKAIVRESFFNTLQAEIIGAHFIEVFSGSASMGLEALSRGATSAVFFEQNKSAYKTLLENIALFKNRMKKEMEIQTFLDDAFKLLPTLRLKNGVLNIIYLDPPFETSGFLGIYEKCFHALERLLNRSHSKNLLVVFEHESLHEMPKSLATLAIIKQKKFGKTTLTYFQ